MDQEMEIGFSMIMAAGDAKNLAMQAMDLAEDNQIDQASGKLEEANGKLNEAHQAHKDCLTRLANGENVEAGLILTHAMDHLTAAELTIQNAQRIIRLCTRIAALEARA